MSRTNDKGEPVSSFILPLLASLNRVGAAVSRISAGETVDVDATLRLIIESAVRVVPGASAILYPFDEAGKGFDLQARVVAGEPNPALLDDVPRANGMGMKAIRERRRILSYEETAVEVHPAKRQAGVKSVVCFPLIAADQPLGAFYVTLKESRAFTSLELLLLENFANHATVAMHHARRLANVHRDLQRKRDELSRLRRAGLLISSRLRLQDTLEAILRMALEVTGARYGILRLVDEQSKALVTKAFAGERLSRPAVESLPINATSITGWVGKYRQPLRIDDVRLSPWSRIYYPLDYDLEMRSELAVPLIGANGRLEGVVNLESPRVAAFSEEDSHLLQSLATQAVIAIQEARLLDALQDITWSLLTEPLDRVLQQLAMQARKLLNVVASAIWLLQGDALTLVVGSGNQPTGDIVPREGSLAGEAVRRRRPVTSEDVRRDPRFYRPELATERGWASALVVPMLIGDDVSDEMEAVGAFSVYSATSNPIPFDRSEWDKKVLSILAHYAALAVHNARRQKELQEVQKQRAVAETFAALGDIAANVLHHLNNKVGTIPVRVQGIEDKCADLVETHPYLAQNLTAIEESARAALDEVRESLSLLHPIRRGPVNVHACVQDALAAVSPPEGIHVALTGLDILPPVVAGHRSLVLVFVNLFQNAIEAMGEEGTLRVRGQREESQVHIIVEDTGPGIPPTLRERVFDFNVSPQGQPHRLGFGLWWVKTLMARLGGSVNVESVPDEGTTFHLFLPIHEES
jgi:Signal transduction histidine kinase regulating C4-dicarboxylate transport system